MSPAISTWQHQPYTLHSTLDNSELHDSELCKVYDE